MTDTSLSIQGPRSSQTFEANSTPLATKTMGINFSEGNDFSVPMQIPDGPEIYLRPDQIDGIKMWLAGASRNILNETPVTVNANGQSYQMTAQQAQAALAGRGALTGGS
ncbi:MAG: hypothetical protein IGS03_07795 [Candidatus Sericytochromatia bacterium]|nr:hypothetical protein [Candidatus Sericytochromatia bacterium]